MPPETQRFFNLKIMEEIWKDVVDYEGKYQVSNWGRMMSLNFNHTGNPKIMKQRMTDFGYMGLSLCKNGKINDELVHRLEAIAFIPNPENKPTVNHKDGNRTNNYLWNLEWNTYPENCTHGYRVLGRIHPLLGKTKSLSPNAKPVNQFTLDGIFVKRWNCTQDIQQELGFCNSGISQCCTGIYKKSHGFIWQFAEPE